MKMIKLFSLTLAAMLLVGFSLGCSSDQTVKDKTGTTTETTLESPSKGEVSTSSGQIVPVTFENLVASSDGILIAKVESIGESYTLGSDTGEDNENIYVMRDAKVTIEQWISNRGKYPDDLKINLPGGEAKTETGTIIQEDLVALQAGERFLLFIQDANYSDKYSVTTVLGLSQGVFQLPSDGPQLADANSLPRDDLSVEEMKEIVKELEAKNDFYSE